MAMLAILMTGALAVPGLATGQDLVATTEAKSPEEERAALHVPPGFEIQLVASEPFIAKPMNLAFDDRGRLWVTSSLEYPFPPEDGAPGRDRVTILSDFAPDGRALTIEQFADDLTIPIGLLPTSSRSALVHSIPEILRLTDTDGDGKADAQEVVLGEYGFRDTHGMTNAFTMGFDGWIYACHGFSNESTVEAKDGEAITMQSGNTYRFRPDGSAIEQWTWGQVNPFGLAIDPLGNLWSSDCHTLPIYHLLRGAYYPSFGKPHDGLGFGPAMMDHQHGSTGIAGIVAYHADHFPEAYLGNIFIGNPVTARVNLDRIEWTGSTPKAVEQPDFVVSDDPWFRPVDLELGPDGALYIADFYNRIIGHYEVPLTHPGRDRERGRIWRVVYVGEDGSNPPPTMPIVSRPKLALSPTPWGLIGDLDHPNLVVRLRATRELARQRPDGTIVEPLEEVMGEGSTAEARVHAMWALERLGALADGRLDSAAVDPDRAVRVHAMKVLADRSGWDERQHDHVLNGLLDEDAFVRRAAADALGRHPGPSNIRPLLDARQASDPADTHLVHVIRMALRDQLRPGDAWGNLPGPMSEADLAMIADVALGVPSIEAARFLLGQLGAADGPVGDEVRAVEHVARHGDEEAVARVGTLARGRAAGDHREGLELLRAIHRGTQARGGRLDEESRGWAVEIARALLASGEEPDVMAAIDLIGSVRLDGLTGDLDAVLGSGEAPEPLRLAAVDARAALDPAGAVGPLGALLASGDEPAAVRDRAAEAIGRLGRAEGDATLIEAMAVAPSRLQRTIAVALSGSKGGAEALLSGVEAGKAPARLLLEPPVQIRLNNAGVEAMASRIEALTSGLPPADEAIRSLIDQRLASFASDDPGDAVLAEGEAVFKAHCAACHKVGGEGEEVGPQLDGVGVRGPLRLMEDILNPNLNVDQAFRATTLALADGRVLTGLLLAEEGDALVLADAEGKPQRIPAAEVDERATAPLSPMPSNFAERIPEEEFRRLVAYLLSQGSSGE
jgi:putative heme-binding domain-containing protein